MKSNLKNSNLKTRREFLKTAARKAAVPVIIVYTMQKATPKLFAREPE
jgi:hypothetical protein